MSTRRTPRPSARTLAAVFEDPKRARAILTMCRTELAQLPAGAARIAECYHAPSMWDVRMTCLSALGAGLRGVESCQVADTLGTQEEHYAAYLNTGDMYAPTLIYWRGRYRVQSLGDFIETQERQGVRFQ